MAEMLTVTNSAEETRALGEQLAERLSAGDVVTLEGELGAGKSELARGIARGLGVTETVTSPSFTILNVYESGRVPLYHFDWYRLESEEELYELGMDEYLGGDGIAVVEWAERCPDAVPENAIRTPVKLPGPVTAAIASISPMVFPAASRAASVIGIRFAECVFRFWAVNSLRTFSSSITATPQTGPDVSIINNLIC